MNTQIWVISFSIISLLALFLQLKKTFKFDNKQLAWILFCRFIFTFCAGAFLIININLRIINSSFKFIIFVIIYVTGFFILGKLEKKYKQRV